MAAFLRLFAKMVTACTSPLAGTCYAFISTKPEIKNTQDKPKPIEGNINQYLIDKNKYKSGTSTHAKPKNIDDEINSGLSVASAK